MSERLITLIEKNLFRIVLLGGLAAFIGVFVYAVHLEEYNKPPEGLRTPFGATSARANVEMEGGLRGNLAVQNFSGREIGVRLEEIIAETLTFTKGDYVYNSSAMEKYFTPEGYAQYRKFLETSGIEQTLSAQNVRSGAYVEMSPLELSAGIYNGTYKWLFEVPVTISFVPARISTYRDEESRPQNRRILLRAQFTRVRDATDPDAVKIEIWQPLPPRAAE